MIATIEDVARLTAALVGGSAPGIESLAALPDVPASAPGRSAGMFWIIEPLESRDRKFVGAQLPGTELTWHNGATGGYSAFLGIERAGRRGIAVLTDTSDGPRTRAIALRLLSSLSEPD